MRSSPQVIGRMKLDSLELEDKPAIRT